MTNPTMKRCTTCSKKAGRDVLKPRSEFTTNRAQPDGLRYDCKVCSRARDAAWRNANKRKHTAPTVERRPVEEFEITVDTSLVPPEEEKTDPDARPLSPLEQAYQERASERLKRQTKQQRDALLDENLRLQAELEAVRYVNGRAPEILVFKQPSWLRSDAVACALISDLHVEEPVDKASVHGLNEYNLDIAKERVRNAFINYLKLATICARDSTIKTLWMGWLGDNFSGWIHEELFANALLAPGEAAIFCKGLFISGVDYLLRESDFVLEIDAIPGNHGRMTKTMHFGNPTGTSLETVMYEAIADRYHNNPRVRLNVSRQSMVYRKFFERFNVRVIHGYETKYLGGIGGLTIPLNKAIAQWDIGVRADLTVLGHYHQRFDGGRFMVNGSGIGFNLYAQQIKASPEEAQQSFFLIDARNGGTKSITAPIWLDRAHQKLEADPKVEAAK